VRSGPVSENVVFRPTLWSVTFHETGLVRGTEWQVTVVSGAGTVTRTSRGTSIVFELVNGTFGYSITPVVGYTATSTGQFLLWGAPIAVEVAFES
jgi:hypothetical protein